jgi:hypothetical protein
VASSSLKFALLAKAVWARSIALATAQTAPGAQLGRAPGSPLRGHGDHRDRDQELDESESRALRAAWRQNNYDLCRDVTQSNRNLLFQHQCAMTAASGSSSLTVLAFVQDAKPSGGGA